MKIPYNSLHVQGGILFAARGGKIHSFSLLDGAYISTWKHPDVEKVANADKAVAQDEAEPAVADIEPPAKRQRLAEAEGESTPAQVDTSASKQNGKKGKRKGKKSQDEKTQISSVPDRPVVTHLTSTVDGGHLLAISGHDKNIWVFEHDGQGHLTQLSQRTMPKRPSSVLIGPDSQIISADKFGDVYSLPLIPTAASASSTPARSSATPIPESRPLKPAANALTVHSKRNRAALINQQNDLERRSQHAAQAKPEVPNFELTLLLGHVSMLTALVLAESEGRRYILTADRDEHIRVSRYLPQAHVIEGFCLGHKEFVSSLVIPAGKEEVLVSGGGESDLFVWDWKTGNLQSKASVLSLAQTISPETTKVSVSGLYTLLYPSETGNLTYVLAICEDVGAIFSWQLTPDNILNHPGITQLPGIPVDLAISPASNESPLKIIVAIHPGETTPTQSLHVFSVTLSDGRISVDTDLPVQDESLEAQEADVPEPEIRRLLFTTENLRKQSADGETAEPAEAEAEMDTEITDAPEAVV